VTGAPAGMAAILLAAGRSSRFGGNKLVASLDGEPLIRHAARTLAALAFADLFVVAGPDTPDLADLGFRPAPCAEPVPALSASLRAGVAAAENAGASSVCIALADMPLVGAHHYAAMFDLFRADGEPVGSRVGHRVQPPALFGRDWFERLKALSGDNGAKGLLASQRAVGMTSAMAADVDTPADLARLRDR